MENMVTFTGLLLLTGIVSIVSADIQLFYQVSEELDQIVWVGNVGQDSNLSSTVQGPVTYKFIGNDDFYQYFDINSNSGILRTVDNNIDRETLCPFAESCVKNLRVAALHGQVVTTINIAISVLDVNDNSPSFPVVSMAIQIAENTLINITILSATDPDMGVNNSVQSYEIVPNLKDVFGLDVRSKLDGTSDVTLRVLQSLDRETRDYYQLFIVAKDGGDPVKTGMLTLNITVTDKNDNKPTFDKTQYDVTINEDIPVNRVFMTMSATDDDIGPNGDVHYRFGTRQPDPTVFTLFNISTVTSSQGNYGEIYVRTSLTVVPDDPYSIIIEASDRGVNKVLSSQAIVSINILDINNNDPVIVVTFVKGNDDALVMENSPNNTVIAFVHVDDADKGVNKISSCFINNVFFRIETIGVNEYKISVNGALDRETLEEHVVTVTCTDGGTPSRSSSSSFIVLVEDENDNPPVFTNTPYSAKITENKLADEFIIRVSATDSDKDANSEVQYSLSTEGQQYFYIDENSGIIKSKQLFDRENKTYYTFKVMANDNGALKKFTSTASVMVTIEDENDNPPVFKSSFYKFEILENEEVTVGRVEADDPDALDNGVVTFQMAPQSTFLPFSVTTDGYIRCTKKLDREEVEHYLFNVTASDHGLNPMSSTVMVAVNVLDINDNPPEFQFPNSTHKYVNLSYLANKDTLITTLIGIDNDAGENGTLSYSVISGNEDDLFSLDKDSGEMFLTRKIRIHEIKTYELMIGAQDHGNPQQSTRDQLWINVQFVNVTSISGVKSAGAGQNIIIAIAIGAITVIFSVLIIITICVIRKLDSRKHVYSAKSAEHMRIVNLKRGSSNRSSSSKGSQDRIMDMYEQPNRKEVSFSLDEEHDNTLSMTLPSTLSSGSGMVTFKSNNSLNIQQNGHLPNHNRDDSLDSGQQQLNRMASLRVQQQLLQQNGRERWRQAQQQQRQMSPVGKRNSGHEDSDMSAASTTDSGNGGSDEDVRHHPSESDCRSGSVSPRQHSTADSAISRDFSANKPSLSTFGYPQNSNGGMSTFPRNPQGKNPLFHNVRDPNLHNLDGAKIQRLHSDSIHPHQYKDIPIVPPLSQGDIYQGDSNLQRANRKVNLTRSYEDTLSDSCVSPRDDDDRATTTSGSYTINPEDLCSEIDELFFRDRGDTVV